MDRNDNPGMVERELDETPVERQAVPEREGGVERESMQGGGVERESMQGGGVERESVSDTGGMEREGLQGGEVERDNLMAGEHGDTRQGMQAMDGGSEPSHTAGDQERQQDRTGGYGYDRPADIQRGSDRGESTSRGMEGTGRAEGNDRQVEPGTMSRDW